MKEINQPEQRTEGIEQKPSPAEMRDARDRTQEQGKRLDELRPQKEIHGPQEHRVDDTEEKRIPGQKDVSEQSKAAAERLDEMQSPICDGSETERKGLTESERAKINDIVDPHYDKARKITENATKGGEVGGERDYKGANFTDHNEAHVKQVEVKTTETLDALVDATKAGKLERADADGDIHFSSNVDYKVTQAAALSHDTGMSDDLYHYNDKSGTIEKQNGRDFDSVRNNHCANSALNVLANREQYKEAGFSDEQINDIAMLAFSHSKSNSGIKDLNSSDDWMKGAERLGAFVDRYNEDHPDNQISFDKRQFENKEKLEVLATESLSLRVGDVSRDSGPDAPAQSGETVHVERKPGFDFSSAGSWQEETAGYNVTVGGRPLDYSDKYDRKSIQVHVGEQNISENHTYFNGDKVVHTITVSNGNHAPYCTAEAIKDHFGEFTSAYNIEARIDVKFESNLSDETQAKYDTARNEMYKKQAEQGSSAHVTIHFPWDKED